MTEVWAVLSAPSFWVTAIVSAVVGGAVSWAFGSRRVAPVLMIASDSRALDDPGLPDVQVTYKGALLVRPAVLRWRIENRGRRDLVSASFDQGRPITLPAPSGATYSAVLSVAPEDLPVQVNDSIVFIAPAIRRAGADWTIDLLVSDFDPVADQPVAGLQNLVGVRHQTAASVLARRRRAAAVLLAIGILMLAASTWSLKASVGAFFVLMPVGSASLGAALGLYGLGSGRRAPAPDSWPGEPRRPRRGRATE